MIFILLVWYLQCMVFTPASADVEQSQSIVDQVNENAEEEDDDLPGPLAGSFEGDILITLEQLKDHYGVPSGLGDKPELLSQVGNN